MANACARVVCLLACLAALAGCGGETERNPPTVFAASMNEETGIIALLPPVVDEETTVDGDGSLRFDPAEAMVIPLFETGDVDVEAVRLAYSASLKTRDLERPAYLEMWCVFEDGGEYFSRGLNEAVSGTTDWRRVETPFFLQAGQNPINVRLNLVISGPGTVWIDDVQLTTGPLP